MDAKKINLRMSDDKQPLKLSADQIPTLVPAEKLGQWMEGDTDPYYKIQKIDYPLKANGYWYTEAFWNSFTGKLNNQLIPGSKSGHETSWGKRAPTDLLLIGAKIESNGDGTGSVYLKNYIPKVGDSGDNAIFIKENKTGMVDYSLVSYTRDQRVDDPDGDYHWEVVESMYGERNDAVGYGEGAMEQKTNAREGDDNLEGVSEVKKDEVLNALSVFKANGDITLEEIAKGMKLENLLITDEQKSNLSEYAKAKSLCGDKAISEVIAEMVEEKKANAEKVRQAKLDEAFGLSVNPVNQVENSARAYAEMKLNGVEITDEKIAEVKEDKLFKKLAAEFADMDSDWNIVGMVDKKTNDADTEKSGVVVV